MPGNWSVHRISIKAKLISSYLIILGAGGLATSLVGSWIVSSALLTQVRRTVDEDFATAKTIYEQKLQAVKLPIEFTASASSIANDLAASDRRPLDAYLARIRKNGGYDFLGLTDASGRVNGRDGAASPQVVKAALSGEVATATESVSGELALTAAAPIHDPNGRLVGALYGGIFLDRNPTLVDSQAGSTTIFRDDVRVATNVRLSNGLRALGGRAAPEVAHAVLQRGEIWRGRTLVTGQWFISVYAPLRDYNGNVIGMLSVGLPESIYIEIRNQVILSFFAIASIGFVVIIGMTYYMVRNITRPLSAMVAATHNIIAGRFDQEVHTKSPGEIAALADSFNVMLLSLRRMREDLEEWGRTLEQKVKQRTEELAAMQARVAQSERLASLGMLAAGVAHEVNNPLGGILALTALTLEDLPENDPDRENLEEVIRQTERCRDIVNRLLEFSRQSKAHTELIDLNDILERTLTLIGKQSLFFNVNIVKHYDPDLPPVLADRSQFQQVFMNLLMNAAQAMNERGTLTIATGRDSSRENVIIEISDTGCGIPQEQIDRIFDPFFTTKASGKGTGLGLSIAYGIVTTHGGSIAVRSETDPNRSDKGSTFTIRVPVAPVPQKEQVRESVLT
jgi:two-component system NtrC family sensor kinase